MEYQNTYTENIPEKAGVYEIQGRKATDGGYTRRYVGTTDNLRKNYSEHLSGRESNEKLRKFLKEKKAFFRYVTSDTEQIRKDIEKGLFTKYRHSFNDEVTPSGSGKYSQIKIEEISS